MSSPKTVAAKKGASEAQIRANRANCLKSTGPKSVEGKAKSSQNAISHGFFSRKVVLEGENAQEFEQLRDALLAEHQPRTVTEQFFVERMAISMWRLNRAQEIERRAHEDMADSLRKRMSAERVEHECSFPSVALWILTQSKHSVLEKLEMYEKRLEGTLHRSTRELQKMRETKSDETKPISEEDESTQVIKSEGVNEESAPSPKTPNWRTRASNRPGNPSIPPHPNPLPGGEGARRRKQRTTNNGPLTPPRPITTSGTTVI